MHIDSRKTSILIKGAFTPENQPVQLEDGWEWRCFFCGHDKFGEIREGKLVIRYKERTLSVPGGIIDAICRRCNMLSRLTIASLHGIEVVTIMGPDDGLGHSLITEAAMKLAEEEKVDVLNITGTGTDGKITVSDIKRYIETTKQEDRVTFASRSYFYAGHWLTEGQYQKAKQEDEGVTENPDGT